MVRVATIEDKVREGPTEPRLIPKALALIAYDHLPTQFLEHAKPWIPTPSLDPISATIRTTFDHARTAGLTCDKAGQRHLDALEYELAGYSGLTVLTINDEPVAALKHHMHGQPNILSFRYVGSANGTYPLIPGGIYTAPANIRDAAERRSKRSLFLAVDDAELYPETMLFEHTCPATSRRKYSIAEQRFGKVIERTKKSTWERWFSTPEHMLRPRSL